MYKTQRFILSVLSALATVGADLADRDETAERFTRAMAATSRPDDPPEVVDTVGKVRAWLYNAPTEDYRQAVIEAGEYSREEW